MQHSQSDALHLAADRSLRRDIFLVGLSGLIVAALIMTLMTVGGLLASGHRPGVAMIVALPLIFFWLAGWSFGVRRLSAVGWLPLPFVLVSAAATCALTLFVGNPNPGLAFVPVLAVMAGMTLTRTQTVVGVLGCVLFAAAGVTIQPIFAAGTVELVELLSVAEITLLQDAWLNATALTAAAVVAGLVAARAHSHVSAAASSAFKRAGELEGRLEEERAVRQMKAWVDEMVTDVLPVGVAKFDDQGLMVTSNPRFAQLLREMFPELPPDADLEMLSDVIPGLREAIAAGDTTAFEHAFVIDDMPKVLSNLAISEIAPGSGQRAYAIVIEDRTAHYLARVANERIDELSAQPQPADEPAPDLDAACSLADQVTVAACLSTMHRKGMSADNPDRKVIDYVTEACTSAVTAGRLMLEPIARRTHTNTDATCIDMGAPAQLDSDGAYRPSSRVVLIAEDNAMLAGLMARIVKSRGYEPVIAHDGREACRQLRSMEECGVLLVHQDIAKLDGVRVAELARIRFNDIAILATSVYAAAGEWFDMNVPEAPARFLRKPFGPRDLVRSLKEIGMRRTRGITTTNVAGPRRGGDARQAG